jgi:hypothetical protein
VHIRDSRTFGDSKLPFSGLHRNHYEIRKNGEGRRERRCRRLRAKKRGKHIPWLRGTTGGHKVGTSLVKFVGSPLKRSQIVAQRPGNSVFQVPFE